MMNSMMVGKSTHGKDMVVVPSRITKMQQGYDGDEQV